MGLRYEAKTLMLFKEIIFGYFEKYSRTPHIRIHLDGEPSGYAENPNNWIFFKIGYIDSLQFGCCYLQYVPASEPFEHA